MTTPDNTAYENRPSHWNATHALTINATGSEISGAFSNANGLSFGLSAGAITASHNALTTAALSNHSHGNPTLNLTNLSGTTASNSAGFTLSLSAGAGGAGDGVNILAAGTQTANTTGTVLFNNGNGISFGMSNSSVITASYTVPSTAGLLSNINVSAGTTSNNLSALTFNNSNGISFGLNGSVITATVQTNYLTTAMASNRGSDFVQANAAFAGTSASGTIASNGISVSIGPYITTGMLSNAVTLSNIRVSGGTTSNLLSAITFGDANGLSFGLNAGTMTASHNALTSQSNQNVTAGNGGFAFQTLSFSNINGISFGTSAGSAITASHNALTTARASNDAVGLNTALTAGPLAWTVNSAGISLNAGSAAGTTSGFTGGASISGSFTHNTAGLAISLSHPAWITTGAASDHSHGNPTLALTNLTGTTASASNGFTLSLSAAAPGAAAITQSIGLSTQTAGGSIAGTTGYATGDDVLYHFVPGSNITMSQSLNGASATLSIYGPAAGGGVTLSAWNPYPQPSEWITSGIGNASLWINPRDVQQPFQYDRFVMPMHFSQATNSTLTVSNTVAWGWYTKNNDTLSLYKSGSGTFSIDGSGTASSSRNSGIRVVSLASTDTITAGNYYLGVVWRSTTAGANASLSHIAFSQWASTISGYIGLASNTRMQAIGGGVWTSTTAGPVPNSIGMSDIRGNSSAFRRQPIVYFTSGEITY